MKNGILFRSAGFILGLSVTLSACGQSSESAPEESMPEPKPAAEHNTAKPSPATSKSVKRYKIPNSDFPIALGVEVPAGKSMVFLSGKLGPVVDPDAPEGTVAAYGDTETQTMGAFKSIQKTLKGMGMDMGDIVKLTLFMVGDPSNDDKLDFAGMMKSYTKFFGTDEQPNLPARSAVQVAALAGPGRLIEIEAIAVRPSP